LVRRQPTAPRVLAVNGADPALYQRFEAIGRPLGPVTHCRVSLGPGQRWVDFDHQPTEAELRALVDPERSEQDDFQIEERLTREHFDPGMDDGEPGGGGDW
jgi:hypothetical protein